jgi:hypothetical protein
MTALEESFPFSFPFPLPLHPPFPLGLVLCISLDRVQEKGGCRGFDIADNCTQVEYQPRCSAHRIKCGCRELPKGARPSIGLPGTSPQPGQPCDASGFPDASSLVTLFLLLHPAPKIQFLTPHVARIQAFKFLRWRSSSQRASIPTSYMRDAARTAYGEGLSEVGLNDIWLFPSVFDLWQQ